MTIDDATLSNLTAEVSSLRRRIDHLERLALVGYCAVVAGLLVVGSFLPFITETKFDREHVPWSLASMVTMSSSAYGSITEESSDHKIFDGFVLTGFIGLALVVILILFVVIPMALAGAGSRRRLTAVRVIVVLGAIGSIVPLLLTLAAMAAEDSEPGWGAVLLCVGMGLSFGIVTGRFGVHVADE